MTTNLQRIDFNTNDNYKANEESIKALIVFILQKHVDMPVYDQHSLFNNLSQIKLHHRDFVALKHKYYNDAYNTKINLLNEKLEYHIDVNMSLTHMRNIEIIGAQINYYNQKWNREKDRENPNQSLLETYTDILDTLIKLHSQLNLGLPVMVYLKKRMEQLGEQGDIISLGDLESLYKQMGIQVDITRVKSDPKAENNKQNGRPYLNVRNDETEHVQQTDSNVSTSGTSGINEDEDGRREEELF